MGPVCLGIEGNLLVEAPTAAKYEEPHGDTSVFTGEGTQAPAASYEGIPRYQGATSGTFCLSQRLSQLDTHTYRVLLRAARIALLSFQDHHTLPKRILVLGGHRLFSEPPLSIKLSFQDHHTLPKEKRVPLLILAHSYWQFRRAFKSHSSQLFRTNFLS